MFTLKVVIPICILVAHSLKIEEDHTLPWYANLNGHNSSRITASTAF